MSAPVARVAFPPNWPARIGLIVLVAYVLYAARILDITWARFVQGLDHGRAFLARMFPPDISPDKLQLLYGGMVESRVCRFDGPTMSTPHAKVSGVKVTPTSVA